MVHSFQSPDEREAAGIAPGLIRLSVGIERAEDIVGDLDRALAGA
jgi:cystathionine beta-lyase/cystathionine gamma-synthase